jgi:hypothetical protein
LRTLSVKGDFTKEHPAGPLNSHLFPNCPSYKLKVPVDMRLQLKIQTIDEISPMILLYGEGFDSIQTSFETLEKFKSS